MKAALEGADIYLDTISTKMNVPEYKASDYSSSGSLWQKQMDKLQSQGGKFTDNEFPANWKSMAGDNEYERQDWKKFSWKRPEEFYNGNIFVFDTIEPNDIAQGELGDCYFLCSLAALAEFPKRVENVLVSKQYNKQGC